MTQRPLIFKRKPRLFFTNVRCRSILGCGRHKTSPTFPPQARLLGLAAILLYLEGVLFLKVTRHGRHPAGAQIGGHYQRQPSPPPSQTRKKALLTGAGVSLVFVCNSCALSTPRAKEKLVVGDIYEREDGAAPEEMSTSPARPFSP